MLRRDTGGASGGDNANVTGDLSGVAAALCVDDAASAATDSDAGDGWAARRPAPRALPLPSLRVR